MSENLAQFLALAEPAPASELLPAQSWLELNEFALHLPFVPRVLLECRLIEGAVSVDLSQGFTLEDFATLRRWLGLPLPSTWLPVRSISEFWFSGSSGLSVSNLWLEHDLPVGRRVLDAPPGVFLQATGGKAEGHPALSLDTLAQLLAQACPDQDYGGHLECISRLMQLPPFGTGSSYVGVMLSRPKAPIRFQLRPVDRKQARDFMLHLKIGGVNELLDLAFGYFQIAVLCLDIDPAVSARVGLELFPSKCSSEDAEIAFLERLRALNLCCPVKLKEVQAWPGRFGPADGVMSWSDSLISRSLLLPEGQLDYVGRRINHYKLVYDPATGLEAKVYLAMEHSVAQMSERS